MFVNNKTDHRKQLRFKGLVVSLGSKDHDVLEKLQDVLGVGAIRVHAGPGMWQWGTGKFEHAQYVVAVLWPWLGERRRRQAVEALTAMREYHARPIKGERR